jgi:hypothetical protein
VKAPKALDRVAQSLYQSALKPAGKNTAKIAEEMRVARQEGFIPKAGEGPEALRAKRSQVGAEIRETVQSGEQLPEFDLGGIEKRVAKIKEGKLPSQRQAIDAAADDIFADYRTPEGGLRQLTPKETFDLKVKLQNAISETQPAVWTGDVAAKGKVNTWRAGVDEARDFLNAKFPEIKDKNALYSTLSDLEPKMDAATKRIGNRDPFGILPTIMSTGGAAAGAVLGGSAGAALGTVGTAVVTKFATDPILRARLAVKLSKASGGKLSVLAARTRLTEIGQTVTAAVQAQQARGGAQDDAAPVGAMPAYARP